MARKPLMRKTRQRTPKRMDVYGIAYSLVRGQPNQLRPDELQEAEVWVIGLITIQWAYLEHMLLFDTARMAEQAKFSKFPSDATSLAFSRRLAAWRLTMEATINGKAKRARLLRLASRIANVKRDRHKIVHGLWEWSPSAPEKLSAYSFRPRVAFRDDGFSFNRLLKLADRIAAINFELTYPSYPTDERKARVWSTREQLKALRYLDFAYASRRFLLQITKKAPPTLSRVVPTGPEHMPPLPPSPPLPRRAMSS